MKRLINWIKAAGLMAVMVGVISHVAPGVTVASSHVASHHGVTTMSAPTYPMED